MKMTEWELVSRARAGDRAAAGDLYSRFWRAARAAAYGVTGDPASAEDAAAEAFTDAFARLDSLRDPDRFGPWLRTIVVRKARLAVRRRGASLEESGDPRDRAELPEDGLLRLELEAAVRSAATELPARLREAVALVYFEGYPADEAARFLSIPDGTLRRRLHDGRARLKLAVSRLLRGERRMNEEQERKVREFEAMIELGELYKGHRGLMGLRVPPAGGVPVELVREMEPLLRPSSRALDPDHPVGAMAAAIRKEMSGICGGAEIRATRALAGSGSVFELLQKNAEEEGFREGLKEMRLSDALDVTWTGPAAMELRSVQEALERLTSAVLPATGARFSAYEEPRYRSALELRFWDSPLRAAYGGVLAARPESAHVRILLEPWAAAR